MTQIMRVQHPLQIALSPFPKVEPNLVQLLLEERARLAVQLLQGEAVRCGAELDEFFLGREDGTVEISLRGGEGAICGVCAG